jgi:hypothetical protein
LYKRTGRVGAKAAVDDSWPHNGTGGGLPNRCGGGGHDQEQDTTADCIHKSRWWERARFRLVVETNRITPTWFTIFRFMS